MTKNLKKTRKKYKNKQQTCLPHPRTSHTDMYLQKQQAIPVVDQFFRKIS